MSLLTACRSTSPPAKDKTRPSSADIPLGYPSTGQRSLELHQRSRPALGTFVTISVVDSSADRAHEAITAAFAEFDHVDGLMSVHRPESEISRVNAEAANGPVAVSEELYQVLIKAMEFARQTDGAFDITIRPLTQLWGFIWKEYRLPTREELQRVLPLVDYRAVQLLPDRTVRFSRPGISIDLGGIGKGHAVDRAIARLQELGIGAAMVKAGGDLRVYGNAPGEVGWEVQLEDPKKEGKRTTLRLVNAAVSTSGNYENFFEVDGVRYSHIVNPKTGLPVQGIAACTVIAPTCMESDVLATALFVYGVERSLEEFGERFPIRFTIVQPDGRTGKMLTSKAFRRLK